MCNRPIFALKGFLSVEDTEDLRGLSSLCSLIDTVIGATVEVRFDSGVADFVRMSESGYLGGVVAVYR